MTTLLGNQAINAAIKSGNVNITSKMNVEVMDLSEESRESQLQHAESLRKLEAQKRARVIVVPTAPEDIKTRLRELRHPITLFGEGPADRRDRLREIIAALELNDEELAKMQKIMTQKQTSKAGESKSSSGTATGGSQKEIFYSPATEAMIESRKYLCDYSFGRGQARLAKTKMTRESVEAQAKEDAYAGSLYLTMQDMCLNTSQLADTRPLTTVSLCPSFSAPLDGKVDPLQPSCDMVASGSVSNSIGIWNARTLNALGTLRGHEERVTSLAWCPLIGGVSGAHSLSSNSHTGTNLLASSSADGKCKLWSCSAASDSPDENSMDVDQAAATGELSLFSSKTVGQFNGHVGPLSDCRFHPSGRFIGTAGHDYTWRLWDVETESELLLQDGHIKDCSAIDFHPDGSLVLTGDVAGVALLWDLRCGQMIQAFQGHVKKITCARFNSNGLQVATGSVDNMVRVWDLRKRKCGYCLPAHSNAISSLKYSASGELMVTCSLDSTVKVWRTRDHQLLKTLTAHSGKVMSCDISSDERHIVSAGYDRSIKLWAHRSEF